MQLDFQIQESKFTDKKSKPSESILLTKRDFEIIRFISEMKFASLQDLYERFFKTLKDGSESKSDWWARERLSELLKHGYLSRIYSFNERKAYFLGTKKGFYGLIKKFPSDYPTRPVETINFNTFEHDKLLISIRLGMEKNSQCMEWISDRTLSQFPELCPALDKSYLPDAIITSPAGEKIAFELEISRKAKKRYFDKIQSYVKCIRMNKDSLSIFKKVVFYVTSDTVKKLLEAETKIYKQYFEIQNMNTIVNGKGI